MATDLDITIGFKCDRKALLKAAGVIVKPLPKNRKRRRHVMRQRRNRFFRLRPVPKHRPWKELLATQVTYGAFVGDSKAPILLRYQV